MDLRLITTPKHLPPENLVLVKEVEADREYGERRERLKNKAGLPDKTQDLLDLVKSDASLALAMLQRSLSTPAITLNDIKQNGHLVKFLSADQRTEEICAAAVAEDQFVITHLSKAERTEKVCLAAARTSGDALFFMDAQERTPAVKMASVKRTGLAIRHLSHNEMTVELCDAAVKKYGRAVEFVPDTFRQPQVCLSAVQECGLAIKHLKHKHRSHHVCLAAIMQNVNAIKLLTVGDLNVDLCRHIGRMAPKTDSFKNIVMVANSVIAQHEAVCKQDQSKEQVAQL